MIANCYACNYSYDNKEPGLPVWNCVECGAAQILLPSGVTESYFPPDSFDWWPVSEWADSGTNRAFCKLIHGTSTK